MTSLGCSTTQIRLRSRRGSEQTWHRSAFGQIAADPAAPDLGLDVADGVGQGHRRRGVGLEDMERQTLGGLGPDAGQLPELIDQLIQCCGIGTTHSTNDSHFPALGYWSSSIPVMVASRPSRTVLTRRIVEDLVSLLAIRLRGAVRALALRLGDHLELYTNGPAQMLAQDRLQSGPPARCSRTCASGSRPLAGKSMISVSPLSSRGVEPVSRLAVPLPSFARIVSRISRPALDQIGGSGGGFGSIARGLAEQGQLLGLQPEARMLRRAVGAPAASRRAYLLSALFF